MKKAFVVSAIFVMAICFVSGQAFAQSAWTGNINLYYGSRSIDSDDWSLDVAGYFEGYSTLEVSDADEFGVNLDFGMKSWPVSIFVGYYMAESDDGWSQETDVAVYDGLDFYDGVYSEKWKLEVETQEIRIGVKKTFNASPTVFPYIMGGVAQIRAKGKATYSAQLEVPDFDYTESDSESISDSDSVVGYWLGGGIYYQFNNKFNLGVEVSYSSGEVSIDDTDLEAGGTHYGLFVGYHW